ncbi:DNA-3-methyladenine glycosylase [Rhodococcus sovatensis]|uniref:Putative 3-methyladenine DNA glycosylase n=1 Tax=Rhodococcus sovatensis TaxID=1805840 RepID=A0ABZ2PTK5_9NOCA
MDVDVDILRAHPTEAARRLVGARIRAGDVVMRIVEVEAYGGPDAGAWPDPAAHSFRGPTPRNSVMFGPAGRLYVYLSYGMHLCVNITCGPDGDAAAVLLRAGEVVEGLDTVRARRGQRPVVAKLASGPGNLGQALGVTLSDNGIDVLDSASSITLFDCADVDAHVDIAEGPRVGVSTAADRPWRFWIRGSAAISSYRRSPRAAPA